METCSQESLLSVDTAARCIRLIQEAADFQEGVSGGAVRAVQVFAL